MRLSKHIKSRFPRLFGTLSPEPLVMDDIIGRSISEMSRGRAMISLIPAEDAVPSYSSSREKEWHRESLY